MKILSISTSSNICSVALLNDSTFVKELNIEDKKTHSENLMPLIKELLTDANCSLSEINLVVCDKGPGSFTGIRIGISTVKAISEVKKIPVIGISSLDALSYNVSNSNSFIASIIDARNNQVYCGVYNSNHELQEDYLADDINNVLPILKKYENIICIGDGAKLHDNILKNIHSDNKIHSYNLGLCGLEKFQSGICDTPDTLLPMYLRKSQAERIKDLNGSSN